MRILQCNGILEILPVGFRPGTLPTATANGLSELYSAVVRGKPAARKVEAATIGGGVSRTALCFQALLDRSSLRRPRHGRTGLGAQLPDALADLFGQADFFRPREGLATLLPLRLPLQHLFAVSHSETCVQTAARPRPDRGGPPDS